MDSTQLSLNSISLLVSFIFASLVGRELDFGIKSIYPIFDLWSLQMEAEMMYSCIISNAAG